MSELVPRPTPLGGTLSDARRLADAADHPPLRQDLLYGPHRGIKRPLIALTTRQNMGPARHALERMTVAGTMVVHSAPFGRAPSAGGPAPSGSGADGGPRVLTFTPPPLKDEAAAEATPSPVPLTPAPPPAAVARPAPAARKPVKAPNAPAVRYTPDGRVITLERHTLEDFNPTRPEDE